MLLNRITNESKEQEEKGKNIEILFAHLTRHSLSPPGDAAGNSLTLNHTGIIRSLQSTKDLSTTFYL